MPVSASVILFYLPAYFLVYFFLPREPFADCGEILVPRVSEIFLGYPNRVVTMPNNASSRAIEPGEFWSAAIIQRACNFNMNIDKL